MMKFIRLGLKEEAYSSSSGHRRAWWRWVVWLFGCCWLLVSAPAQADCVIVLHGIARSSQSMADLAEALGQAGFSVHNIDYESTATRIERWAEPVIDEALARCDEEEAVNFVTYSMGGIVVRYYLSRRSLPALNRVVMLAPPNKGSEVVDAIADVPGFYWIYGDPGLQLGTGEASLPKQLGAVDFDVGIIAGNGSINPIGSTIIPGEDDGTVSVESTKLEGMRDHIVISASHTFIMNNEAVIQQVIHYLKHGTFKK